VLFQQQLGTVKAKVERIGAGDYQAALTRLAALREPVDSFFNEVMVMADDEVLKANRLALFAKLQITPLAEGIETREEMACLRELGISLMQGYLFARTGFETLPEVDFASL
jgi:predicted signal transduction protein with EAL and GGDEF domain